MRKPAAKKIGRGAGTRKRKILERSAARRGRAATMWNRNSASGELRIDVARFEAVMKAAERSGLLSEKSSRIAGRVSPTLVEQAKKQTGITGDTDLIAFALASVALEDNFGAAFKVSRGKVSTDLKLGF
jgi:hypothetical protein